MAWAEAHMITGLAMYFAGDGNLAASIPLSVMSHWPLDDLNIGDARIYHGIGQGWRRIIVVLFRVPIWLAILYLFYRYPGSMACALPAWLVLDHEWVLRLWHKEGYGLHKRMFPRWLWSEWGLLVWFVAYSLGLWLLF